jgi:hypothetical protein
MVSGSQLFYYARVRTFAPDQQDRLLLVSQVFHVDFAMAVAATVTMLIWTSLTPDRRDALVLGPLPITPGEQGLARLVALSQFVSLFAIAVAVPTSIVFTFVTLGASGLGNVLAHVAGHIAGVVGGSAFVFFILVDLQLLVAATLGPRAVRTLTWPLQAAALLAMVASLSMASAMADAIRADGASRSTILAWNPAAWFVGLYRWVAGDTRPIFSLLAGRAAWSTLVAVGGALAVYPLAYERCLRNVVAAEGRAVASWTGSALRWCRGALGVVLRSPIERALAGFIIASLTRSHAHRFVIGSYVGIGLLCALPLAERLLAGSATPEARYAWFSVPLGLLCWSSAGLRVAMMLPIEPAANWIFRLTEPVNKRRLLSTAVVVVQAATAVPLATGFGLASGIAGGWLLGVMVFALILPTGLGLAELLSLRLHAVPCACTYRPGQLRLRVLWPLYLSGWLMITFQLPALAVRRADDPVRFARLVLALVIVWLGLRMWRLLRARGARGFVYEELEEAATTTIDLNTAGA